MAHARHGDGFQFDRAAPIAPAQHARRAHLCFHRSAGEPQHIVPLGHDSLLIGNAHGAVGIAMPHRNARPRTCVLSAFLAGGLAHRIAPFAAVARRRAVHGAHRFAHVRRRAMRQARNDGAGGEEFGIGRQHGRCHAAARRQAGDENARGIADEIFCRFQNHLSDGGGLALVAAGVARLEPVEAGAHVVRHGLFRRQQGKAETPRQLGPARARIQPGGGLAAAMQDDQQRRARRQAGGLVAVLQQGARIGARQGLERQGAFAAKGQAVGKGIMHGRGPEPPPRLNAALHNIKGNVGFSPKISAGRRLIGWW